MHFQRFQSIHCKSYSYFFHFNISDGSFTLQSSVLVSTGSECIITGWLQRNIHSRSASRLLFSLHRTCSSLADHREQSRKLVRSRETSGLVATWWAIVCLINRRAALKDGYSPIGENRRNETTNWLAWDTAWDRSTRRREPIPLSYGRFVTDRSSLSPLACLKSPFFFFSSLSFSLFLLFPRRPVRQACLLRERRPRDCACTPR